MSDAISIINDDDQDYIPSPFPDTDGVFFKVLKADEENNRVVMKFKFAANSALPRHRHHCRAVAYTISGEWEYEEGQFKQGHVAYEGVGNDHTASSKTGAELFYFLTATVVCFSTIFWIAARSFVWGCLSLKPLKGFRKRRPLRWISNNWWNL